MSGTIQNAPASGLTINVTYDASAASAPSGFKAAVNAAVQYLQSAFATTMTLNISMGWGEVGGSAMDPGALGESFSYGNDDTYAQVRAALAAKATSADDAASVATLPVSDPTAGGSFYVTNGEAKALGLVNATGTAMDGAVGLGSGYSFTYDPNNRAVSGDYDAIGTLEHEITEVMGRVGSLGTEFGTNVYTPLDLFRYSAPNQRQLAPGAGSFSVDGKTLLQAYNNPNNGGDATDWIPSLQGDSFGDGYRGEAATVSAVDLREMDVLGYKLASTPTPTISAQITGAASAIGTITNAALPTLSGVATAGATVTLRVNGTVVGSATANAGTGAWSTTLVAALGGGANQISATASVNGVSSAAALVNVFALGAPVGGVSTPDAGSFDLATLTGQGYAMQFVSGTEAIQLVDGTWSFGPDTNEAALQRLYEGLLGRGGDSGGLAVFDQQLAAGASLAGVATAFLASGEFQALHGAASATSSQFVTVLYQGFLGRAPDSGGLANWVGALSQGMTRGQVAASFAQSGEAKAHLASTTTDVWAPSITGGVVTAIYETGLGRAPDLGGLQAWTQALNGGLAASAMAQQIAGSAEFLADHSGQGAAAFVTSLYQQGLGRTPDAGGLQNWVNALQSGTSQGSVLWGIASSAEASAHLLPRL